MDKKEFSIKINGVQTSIKEVQSLEAVLAKLNATADKASASAGKVSTGSRGRAAAATEEEKAQQRLANTLKRLEMAGTELARQQAAATQAVREKNREVSREVQISQLAEGSIRRLGMELTDLRNAYDLLSEAERENVEIGGAMLTQINEMDSKYKALKESTGRFQDSVGNYAKFTGTVSKATEAGLGFAKMGMTGIQTLQAFGLQAGETSEEMETMNKIVLGLTLAQQLNNTVLAEGSVVSKILAGIEAWRAKQTATATAATEANTASTVKATIAQRAFNLVAQANPYLLLAAALLTVVGAMAAYRSGASSAASSADKFKSSLTGATFATKEARDAHDDLTRRIRDLQIEIDLAIGKITEYQASLIRLSNEGIDAMDALAQKNKEAADQMAADYSSTGKWLDWLLLKGNVFRYGFDNSEYLKQHSKEYAKLLKDQGAEALAIREENDKKMEVQLQKSNAEIRKQNEDARAANIAGVRGEIAQIGIARTRELEEAKKNNEEITKLNRTRSKDQQLELIDTAAISAKYAKQEADARKAAAEDANSKRAEQLQKQKEALQAERELIRQAEDAKTGLITDEFARRRQEIERNYKRQREDLERRLTEEKTLTKQARQAINDIIATLDDQQRRDEAQVTEEEIEKAREEGERRQQIAQDMYSGLQEIRARELAEIELWARQRQEALEAPERTKGRFKVFDPEATKKDLDASLQFINEYAAKIVQARQDLKESHDMTVSSLVEGSEEYEKAQLAYAQADADLNTKLLELQKQREANLKRSNGVMLEYYQDLMAKISEYAQVFAEGVTAVTDTVSLALGYQVEALNEQLEELDKRFDEVSEKREESAERAEDFERRLQDASGGTAAALRESLADEIATRNALAREEQRIAKEKEKREAEIARKEKQMKRADLISSMAQGIANTAQAVTKALTLVWPLNLLMAGLVGSMGTVQVGIMGRQLTKLADGGVIQGPSHLEGGVQIPGTNIEVEGGEQVTNKISTAANPQLLNIINEKRGPVTLADILPAFAGSPAPVAPQRDTADQVAEALQNIEFKPVVSVVDINDAQDNLASVEDLAGY